MTRIARVAASIDRPLLVTGLTNVRYLTGFRSSNAAMLVEPDAKATLWADFRYAESGSQVEGVTFVVAQRNLLGFVAQALSGRSIAFEAQHLSYEGYETLAAHLELEPSAGVVEALREVKDAAEIAAIRRAAELSDAMFADLAEQPFTGRTERDLAWWIERRLRDLGAEHLSFDVAVASGERGAMPHAHPTELEIPHGTLVTVDAGCVVGGYCSDCTRTFATGALPDELAHAYDLCLRSQVDALHAIAPGASAAEIDALSRRAIEEAGLGPNYGHGLGHGVGLEVHEGPAMRPGSEAVLQAGNVVTAEPGIYLPGSGGVRIEDLVLVTEQGHERLTQFPKDLVTVA